MAINKKYYDYVDQSDLHPIHSTYLPLKKNSFGWWMFNSYITSHINGCLGIFIIAITEILPLMLLLTY